MCYFEEFTEKLLPPNKKFSAIKNLPRFSPQAANSNTYILMHQGGNHFRFLNSDFRQLFSNFGYFQ